MPENCLQGLKSYTQTVAKGVQERRAEVLTYLDETYSPRDGWEGKDVVTLMHEKGVKKGHSETRIYEDLRVWKTIYKFCNASPEERAETIAEAEADHLKRRRNPVHHAVWCYAHPEGEHDPKPTMTAEDIAAGKQAGPSAQSILAKGTGPLHTLADIIDPVIAAYEARDGIIEELQFRVAGLERDNRKLKEKFSSIQHMLAALEAVLLADIPRLDQLKTRAEGLGVDLAQNLPEQTATGGYWKQILDAVYRKKLKKYLRDAKVEIKERESIVEVIKQIMIDPFCGLKTELRHNGDDGDASMIAGIARGLPYYYSYVGIHRRIIWLVEGKRIHFVETGMKKNYE